MRSSGRNVSAGDRRDRAGEGKRRRVSLSGRIIKSITKVLLNRLSTDLIREANFRGQERAPSFLPWAQPWGKQVPCAGGWGEGLCPLLAAMPPRCPRAGRAPVPARSTVAGWVGRAFEEMEMSGCACVRDSEL